MSDNPTARIAQLEAERDAARADAKRRQDFITGCQQIMGTHGNVQAELTDRMERLERLEAENAELKQRLQYASAPVDKGIPMHAYKSMCAQRDEMERQLAKAHQRIVHMGQAIEPLKRFADRLDLPPNWVPDGCPINTDPGGISDFTVGNLRTLRAALAATAPAVAEYEARLKAEGAAEAANELAILRNARKVGEHYLRECIESRQSRDRQGSVTNSWAVVVIPDWQFRQMLYGIEPEARAAALEARQ